VNAAAVRAALAAVGAGGVSAIRGVTRLDVEADEQLSLLVEKASP
jgi:hypothetical protein